MGKGCDLKDGDSCASATANCVKEGEFQDFALAFQLATKGCEIDDYKSCYNLSLMYQRGDGVLRPLFGTSSSSYSSSCNHRFHSLSLLIEMQARSPEILLL